MKKKSWNITTFKKTTDNWYPNLPDDQVSVTVSKGCISVWGDDDFGMGKSFTNGDEKVFFRNLPEVITIAWLKEKGFTRA